MAEERNKKGQFCKGITPWNKGKSPEYAQGENHPMYGKKHSLETRKKMSRKVKATYRNGHKAWNAGIALGLYGTPFYHAWQNMKSRCQNTNDKSYRRYGKRGVFVCKKWQEFSNFHNDMFSAYKKGLTLDRIDNDDGYFKENCRWATRKQQAGNRRSTRIFEYAGIADILPNWATFLGIKRSTLAQRIYGYNWSIEKAFSSPVRERGGSYR